MQSFKSYLSLLYGEPTVRRVRTYERNSIRRTRYINNLTFLKCCRDSHITPRGLKLHDPVCSNHSLRILQSASRALLRVCIQHTRRTLSLLDKDITATEAALKSTLHQPSSRSRLSPSPPAATRSQPLATNNSGNSSAFPIGRYPDGKHHPRPSDHTLVNRAYEMCDQNKLRQELHHIKSALKMNGYRNQRINLSKPSPRTSGSPIPEVPQTPTAIVCLPYLGPTSHQLRSILQSANIKVHHSAPNKLQAALHTTRTSTHPVVAPVYIAFHLNAAKYTSGKLEGTSPPDSKNTTRTADEKNTSLPSSNMHTPGPAHRVGQSRTHCSHPELAPKENPRSY